MNKWEQDVSLLQDFTFHDQVTWGVVASNLEMNRWYHLALTYDNSLQRQDVFLDGLKVRSETGALHPEWGFLSHEQVGTGCITAGSLDFPRPKYLGWYGFHGMIDEFRIWGEALCQDDLAELVHGCPIDQHVVMEVASGGHLGIL
ncbi:hypothetical protein BBO99_00008963 [Phytophthora kernoviae]|uniref:LamG-like jellyroll fold domain-containing protein n=1 Tax=Phytophthora kernoviae TaxID=325452 RepID=A0A421GDY4_9STRA|nr:hypothetical protein JM16_008588 [Phytophthora kernoviae]KAG2510819.1 hypothetical protein JM18_008814 [Phytophthora kernoviae]RLN45961.1 hypothetical protein BBI17_008971 [Phytophthora kernoviae]RLN74379.1 hypothetical protein BBO99_00008963 [Phytophthora kernoviae]